MTGTTKPTHSPAGKQALVAILPARPSPYACASTGATGAEYGRTLMR